MADNLDKELDADILQCRTDILRIRQSIANSRSGEVTGQEVRAVDSAAGLRAEIETSNLPQEHEASLALAQEPAPKENPYAVTRDEVNALLNSEAAESSEVANQSAQVEDEPAQVSNQIDALFGDEVEMSPEPAEGPVAETELPVMEDELEVPEEPVEVKADFQEMTLAVQEDWEHAAAEEPPVTEAASVARPEIEAAEPELADMVAEAEEWMAQVAPEGEREAVVSEVGVHEDVTASVAAEPPAVEEAAEVVTSDMESPEALQVVAPSDLDIDSPALEPATGEAVVGQFDEVVSQLQGEESIVPVEEEEDEQEDVKLRIIQDMKDEGQKSDQDRSGVPRLDLSESDLAGIVESRRNAAATRKGPGRKEKLEVRSPEPEAAEDESDISNLKEEAGEEGAMGVEPEAMEEKMETMRTEVTMIAREKMRLEKEKQVVARIVARDIERFCASAARLREKERAGQR